MANNKHLTLSDRSTIETQLDKRTSFKLIALALDKDPSTISKEVRAHLTVERVGGYHIKYNACINRQHCLISGLCSPCNAGKRYKLCRSCGMCNRFCPDFVHYDCPLLSKPPYVCNGCSRRPGCTLEKHVYHAKTADDCYRTGLSEQRKGISYCEEDLMHFDSIITPLIMQSQSIHHICATNYDRLMVSERTIYRLIDDRLLTAMNIDLPRKVRFKQRKNKKTLKMDRHCRKGREYECFLEVMEDHPDFPITQIDTVEGRKGGKVLLTIHFVRAGFMLAFLRSYNDSRSVTVIFDRLYECLGPERFRKLFDVILTDNGSEFSHPSAIEFDAGGDRRAHLFYCDPNAPFQKGAAERNHEFIRLFIPKGKPFDDYTQTDISRMMDHINSYARESLSNKCPFDMFEFLYGKDVLDILGCHRIPSRDVTLNRSIFKKDGEIK